MPVYKAEVLDNYTPLPNYTLQDKSISAEAKGVLVLMLSMPPDWAMYKSWLIDQCPGCGRDKMGRILKELEQAGYLHREQTKDKANGKFDELTWWIFPLPQPPGDWKPVDGSPVNGKSAPTKETDIQKKHNTNTCQSVGSTPRPGELKESIDKLRGVYQRSMIDEPEPKPNRLDTKANAVKLMRMWNDRADEYGTNWQRVDDPEDTSAIRYRRGQQRINQVKRRMDKKGVEPTLENVMEWFDRFLHHMGNDPWYSGHPTETNPKGYRLTFQQAFREDYFNDAIERLNQKQSG